MIKRILIVGLGSIGKRHLRLARKFLPQAEIAVLRHKVDLIIPEGADYIFSNMVEALAFAPTLAIVTNPATLHLSAAMRLAEAGVHLLIEKPLSVTTEGVKDLIETCKKKNAVLAIGYNLRYLQSLKKFKSMVDDQVIGSIWSVRSEVGQYLPSWRPGSDYRQGVSAQSALGGGVLLELSHEIDYLRWIFGEVDWVQAVLTQQSDLEIDVEDTAHLVLGFAANSSERSLVASVNLDFIRQDTTRQCTAIGKLGSLRWNGIAGTVELWSHDTEAWYEVFKHQTNADESYAAEWKNMIACIEHGSLPFVTGLDGLEVLKIIDASRLSTKARQQVEIDRVNDVQEV
ncbi:Gfo/Idh/MocA family oxidoreductase [Amylibacter sp.]|nr:Gfo/Idh/MocA family oxidoreductase [Amylibacter sp.]